jgi:hypothetical protein
MYMGEEGWAYPRETDHLEDLGVDWKAILNFNFQKEDGAELELD